MTARITETQELIEVEVTSIVREALDIKSYELRRPDGGDLPWFSAGAHIDLHLPQGLTRSYSLCNKQGERERYVITVANHVASRGGSKFIHEQFNVGTKVLISAPMNNFCLAEASHRSIFIAGGIGITPIWAMIQRLYELGRLWKLFYAVRSRAQAPFLDLLDRTGAAEMFELHCDEEHGGEMLDIGSIVACAALDDELYCCGPRGMLESFERATSSRPSARVHVEYFSVLEEASTVGGFTVVLDRSKKEIVVEEGETILNAVLRSRVDTRYSCMEGTCGECIVRVLEGTPDHRDVVMDDAEHALNNRIAVCCSGSKSKRLVLDL